MKFKTLMVLASTMALSIGAHAGTMDVALNQTAPGFWTANYDSDFMAGPILGGAPGVLGTDTISFTSASLSPGTYSVELNFMEITNGGFSANPINVLSATLNGLPISFAALRSFDIDGVTTAPFVLSIHGATNVTNAGYHGSITVTPVPEPETYAMFFAGLGLMATIARRRDAGKSNTSAVSAS